MLMKLLHLSWMNTNRLGTFGDIKVSQENSCDISSPGVLHVLLPRGVYVLKKCVMGECESFEPLIPNPTFPPGAQTTNFRFFLCFREVTLLKNFLPNNKGWF